MPDPTADSSTKLRFIQGLSILSIQGTPFELGFQHGLALKEKIHQNILHFLKTKPDSLLGKNSEKLKEFLKAIPSILPHIPQKYIQEMQGVAEGASACFSDILLLNLFPEMFHCCGVTVSNKASKDGSLYHVRVLDYSAGKGLQSSAVILKVKPNEGIPFLNITYAGFIGSVTGMNEEKISIGEIGGQGYGNWDGMPMSFLLRSILEETKSLEEIRAFLLKTPRTCEYYYLFADGKTEDSFASYATEKQLKFIYPGEWYSITPSSEKTEDLSIHTKSPELTQESLFKQPTDTLIVTGLSSPERYPVLLERILDKFGSLDSQSLIEIIRKPVALDSNLHNAIFHPSSLTVWVSHAHVNGNPAYNEPYTSISFNDLG